MGISTDTISQDRSLGTATDSESASGLPRNEIFEVLSNRRRQCILHYLKQQDSRRVELRELVDYVAAWENDTSIEALDSNERKRVYTALRQSHLPRLDDVGIIDYENRRGEIVLTDQAEQVQMYLEYVPANDIPWSEYYLGLSAVGAALVTVTWLGIFPFGGLSGIALAAILVVLFAVSGVVHTYESKSNRIGDDAFEVRER